MLTAAERIIEAHGLGALSLRELAEEAGTTTRAVYSLFGSKEGLLGGLGARAFELLQQGLDNLCLTQNPRGDLIAAALVFRRFALDHPALFSVGIQRADPTVWPRFRTSAAAALAGLHRRFEPLTEAGLLGGRSIPEAACEFHALCEGLASIELRGTPLGASAEQVWRSAFHALIAGFADPVPMSRASSLQIDVR